MKRLPRKARAIQALAAGLLLSLPLQAQAHRSWLLPSATVLSGNAPWVTVDAAVSTDLFHFEHTPLKLDDLSVLMPDGTVGKAEHLATGQYRSSFDVALQQAGTWKFGITTDGLLASWEEQGERKRWRGSRDAFSTAVPARADKLEVVQTGNRVETFVTLGKPSTAVFKPTGKGLELVPLTHPNDLVAGETSRFRLLKEGAAAAGLTVSIIPGGKRYRNQLDDREVLTDQDGIFTVTWPQAGMYWLNASLQDEQGEAPATRRRMSYALTLEVLAP